MTSPAVDGACGAAASAGPTLVARAGAAGHARAADRRERACCRRAGGCWSRCRRRSSARRQAVECSAGSLRVSWRPRLTPILLDRRLAIDDAADDAGRIAGELVGEHPDVVEDLLDPAAGTSRLLMTAARRRSSPCASPSVA